MIRGLGIACAFAALAGCATPYQSGGFAGGHRQQSGPGRLEKISFHGNGYIDAKTVQQYALYRCAELAREKNKPYFFIYDSLVAASLGRPAELPAVGMVGNKPTAFAFFLTLDAQRAGAKETGKVLADLEPIVKQVKSEPAQ